EGILSTLFMLHFSMFTANCLFTFSSFSVQTLTGLEGTVRFSPYCRLLPLQAATATAYSLAN
ncbi:MAG: hypothetical protein ACQESJ_05110, partial [Bacteroidota bacterium]